MNPVKTLLALSILLVSSAASAADLSGRYELTGVMEMAGVLSLKPGGRYAAGFTYGAADWVEEGDWKAEGDAVVLSGSRFKAKNADLPLFLPAGTRFLYKEGRLTATGPGGKVVFVDPAKTPSPSKAAKAADPDAAGEGRMRVKGKVVKLDAQSLLVNRKGECLEFIPAAVPPDVLKAAQVGKAIDAEIPFSAMMGSMTCPY